ncbi:MAG: LysR family transcriptional regulator [Subtercola sp.]|nr:LysR family transcriptional regulator [Subtercola sp.]
MEGGRVKLERQKLDGLAALAAAFGGTPEGDAVVTAVDALSRSLRESSRRASGARDAASQQRASGADVPVDVGEPLVVALAADDELARREAVAVTDLADRHLLHNPDEVPQWRDIATELLGPTIRTSQSFALGPLATLDEQLDHVAAGHGIIIVPRSRAESAPRHDVTLVVVDF